MAWAPIRLCELFLVRSQISLGFRRRASWGWRTILSSNIHKLGELFGELSDLNKESLLTGGEPLVLIRLECRKPPESWQEEKMWTTDGNSLAHFCSLRILRIPYIYFLHVSSKYMFAPHFRHIYIFPPQSTQICISSMCHPYIPTFHPYIYISSTFHLNIYFVYFLHVSCTNIWNPEETLGEEIVLFNFKAVAYNNVSNR